MVNLRAALVPCVPLLLVAGCGLPGQIDPSQNGTVEGELTTGNGHEQNGHEQNGHEQNGSGLVSGGVDLTTMARLINGSPAGTDPDVSPGNLSPIPNVKLVGSKLVGTSLAGTDFQWHVVQGWVTDKQKSYPATYYLETLGPSAADPEIYNYNIRVRHQVTDPRLCATTVDGSCPMIWEWACGTHQVVVPTPDGGRQLVDVPYMATAVGGQWDYHEGVAGGGRKVIEQGNPDYDTKITFACETGAIGKCVSKIGYKPWALGPRECRLVCDDGPFGTFCRPVCEQHTRELLHEACVRMIRADYCGDGNSHTVDGVTIDVWDNAGLQSWTPSSNVTSHDHYGREAEWTPNGARCLRNVLMTRLDNGLNGQSVQGYLLANCPHKWDGEQNQVGTFHWEDNDCIAGEDPDDATQKPVSMKSTFNYANVPATGFDWHHRVYIKNTSMCVTDRPIGSATFINSAFTTPPCLGDAP